MSALAGPIPVPEDLRDAIEHCRVVTRARAANFYWGLRLTPQPKRAAMYAIYAWMREADDLVDEVDRSADAARGIEAFRAATDIALGGTAPLPAPLWRAMAWVARTWPLERRDFAAMIDGQVADLVPRRLERWDELRAYCEQVASTVGRVCVCIWGANDPRAASLATERGVAFQLVNVIRDVAEDASLGRVYIPAERFAQAGIGLDDLLQWRDGARCRALLDGMVAAARERFAASEGLESMIAADCRPTLRGLSGMYRALLERIANDPQQVVRGRVRVPALQKAWVVLRARVAGSR